LVLFSILYRHFDYVFVLFDSWSSFNQISFATMFSWNQHMDHQADTPNGVAAMDSRKRGKFIRGAFGATYYWVDIRVQNKDETIFLRSCYRQKRQWFASQQQL
jgi:hypothetical protein